MEALSSDQGYFLSSGQQSAVEKRRHQQQYSRSPAQISSSCDEGLESQVNKYLYTITDSGWISSSI